MNHAPLIKALRQQGDDLQEKIENNESIPSMDLRDPAELVLVLARILEGKSVDKAFGAPGDWGYSTPIGKALYEAYGDV
jgi:hypothetical protein